MDREDQREEQKHLAKKNGLPISADQIEVQMLAGGEALGCIRALCRAKELGKDADWNTIATIDLAGADVKRVVESDFDLRTFVGGADPGGRKEGLRKRPT